MASFINSLTTFMCYTSSLQFGNNTIIYNNRPTGNCLICCSVQEETDITYTLYTLRNPGGLVIPQEDPGRTALSVGAKPEQLTVIFLHGFSDSSTGWAANSIKDAYLKTGDYNIFLVDWSKLVASPWYRTAVSNSRLMGRNLAKFILKLDRGGLPLNQIHVIGFSLGAEAAGFAGKLMPTNKRIPRITGLDPAFPLYSRDKRERLADGDAGFVDVIHTDSGILGYPTPMGDADFYPNGGVPFQPGCRAGDIGRIHGFNLNKYVSCSHSRAWQYYVESILNPLGFPSTRCPRWTGLLPPCQFKMESYMGIMANPSVKGKFYLQTNENYPFSRNGTIEK